MLVTLIVWNYYRVKFVSLVSRRCDERTTNIPYCFNGMIVLELGLNCVSRIRLVFFTLTFVLVGCRLLVILRWMRGIRAVEQSSDRASREIDIRRSLRDWDHRYPEIHHELIVRWVCGAVVSVVVTSIYNGLVRRRHSSRRY